MIVDAWTLGHVAWGLVLGFISERRLWPVVAVAFAWEWFENAVVSPAGFGDPSWSNSLADVAAAVLAAYAVLLAKSRLHARVPPWAKDAVHDD